MSNSLFRPDEGEPSSYVPEGQLKTHESSSSSCKYKGVRKRKWGKWVSEVRLPNSRERIWLGSYDSPVKAARAFDAAQFCLRGKSANFNFPDNPPEIPGGRSMTPSEIQSAAARFANLATTNNIDNDMSRNEEPRIECDNQIEDIVTDSPTISEGTVQIIDDSEMIGADTSFHEQLSLSSTLGSGNYVSEFGYFTGFDYMASDYNTTIQPDDNYHGYNGDDTYDTSIYQDSCLWNF